ncbi:hypothetical protein GCM10019016_083610 [Streptomyces prasinosporus]|uniref:Uncharacterized protein n=1 Tax=Streptomyces prasinosporus TaxID=68256 RepID=A0ABP6U1J2_9ACTN
MAHRLRRRGAGRQAARPTLDTSGGAPAPAPSPSDDLAAWSATYEDPVTYDFDGWTVCKAGPVEPGPGAPPATRPAPDEVAAYGSAAYLHLLIENCKLAMADARPGTRRRRRCPLDDLLSAASTPERRTWPAPRASHESVASAAPAAAPRLAASRARRAPPTSRLQPHGRRV